jgi:hypothetical protein
MQSGRVSLTNPSCMNHILSSYSEILLFEIKCFTPNSRRIAFKLPQLAAAWTPFSNEGFFEE